MNQKEIKKLSDKYLECIFEEKESDAFINGFVYSFRYRKYLIFKVFSPIGATSEDMKSAFMEVFLERYKNQKTYSLVYDTILKIEKDLKENERKTYQN